MSRESRVDAGLPRYIWAFLIALAQVFLMQEWAVVYAEPHSPLSGQSAKTKPASASTTATADLRTITVVGSEAAKFAKLIIPEFLDYVIRHDIRLRLSLAEGDASPAMGSPDSHGQVVGTDSDQRVERVSSHAADGAAELSSNLLSERLGAKTPGPPFSLEELQSGRFARESSAALLWGPVAREWAHSLVEYRGRMLWFQGAGLKPKRSLRFSLQRVFLRTLPGYALSDQMFRELFRFIEAEDLRFYSVLTFRFMFSQRDRLWWNSPAVNGVLEMPWTLRSRELLGSGISLEDFNVWSGHARNCINPEVTQETKLIPMLPAGRVSVANGDGCESLRRGISHFPWSSEGGVGAIPKGYDHSAVHDDDLDWLPLVVSLVSRAVTKVECLNDDPFKDVGSETIYFDSGELNPLARIVRDRRGRVTKLIIGFFSEVMRRRQEHNEQESFSELVPEVSLALNASKSSAAAFDISEIRRCSADKAVQVLQTLQPAALRSEQ